MSPPAWAGLTLRRAAPRSGAAFRVGGPEGVGVPSRFLAGGVLRVRLGAVVPRSGATAWGWARKGWGQDGGCGGKPG
jgi:hypothetical protein